MSNFSRKLAIFLLLTLIAVGVAASMVMLTDIYLLVFLAILLSVFIYRCSKALENWSSLPYKASFSLVVMGTLLVICGVFALFGFQTAKQVEKTAKQLSASYSQVGEWIKDYPVLRSWLRDVPIPNYDFAQSTFASSSNPSSSGSARTEQGRPASKENKESLRGQPEKASARSGIRQAEKEKNAQENVVDPRSENGNEKESTKSTAEQVKQASQAAMQAVERARKDSEDDGSQSPRDIVQGLFGILGNAFATTFGATTKTIFVLFISVFLAANPATYRNGVLALVPSASRSRADDILAELEETLFGWLRGRGLTMLITGIGTGAMLWLLGVPLAFTLGLLTGALTFIPTIGAILALVLSAIVAASQGLTTVLLVVLLYVAFQLLESNVISPLVQKHSTSVPPAVLLTSQLLMGVLAGFLGILVAVPLVASIMVLVKEIYIKDILE